MPDDRMYAVIQSVTLPEARMMLAAMWDALRTRLCTSDDPHEVAAHFEKLLARM
jgi:hypothetical protein